jgi:hypothetical protein
MEKTGREKIKHAVSACVFLIIAGSLFVFFTYLFRTVKDSTRLNIAGFYNEEKNTVDMAMVGSSAVFRFWDPMLAYEESGLASYDYACASMTPALFRCAVEEVLSRQDPDLLVIDGRRWITDRAEGPNERVRFYLDTVDLNWNRFRAVWYYCRKFHLPFEESVPLFLDLCLYHNNTEALANPLNWELADNRYVSPDNYYLKGYMMKSGVKQFNRPSDEIVQSTRAGGLGPVTQSQLRDLLSYLSSLNRDVLFVFTPYVINEEEMQEFNEVEQIAAEYGIPVWNGNRYYDEIGLDFSSDFYDSRHTNIIGSEKVTKYLLQYIKEHYDLPDHRSCKDRPSYEDSLAPYREKEQKVYAKAEKKAAKKAAKKKSGD